MSHHEIKVRQGQIFCKIEQIFKFLCKLGIHHSQLDDAEVWSMLSNIFVYYMTLLLNYRPSAESFSNHRQTDRLTDRPSK